MTTPIPTLPPTPSRSDPTTFSDKSDALLGALDPWAVAVQAVGDEAEAAAVAAAASVVAAAAEVALAAAQVALATTQANNAENSATASANSALVAGAVAWVSGTTYAIGDTRYSPINFQTYRRTTNGGGTTDPSLDSANWTKALASGVTSVTTATGMTTLTSTPTLLQITPASYGIAVTLPDATTCSLGGPLHIIDNKGAYPVRVLNSAGTLLGFIFAGLVSHVSLIDNSTAAGTWTVENSELVGASAQLLTTNIAYVDAVIDIGSSQEVIVGRKVSTYDCYAVVYNRATNTFGSVTLVRAGTLANLAHQAVLSATNQVLVCTCSATTAFEAVTLSISGTTITVNTAATATLSANISAFADGCGLIAVGSSFVTSYTVATPAAQIRALSISGTTVTIGSATVLDGTDNGLIANASTGVIAASAASGTIYHKYYGVSGTTITTGSGGSFGTTSGAVICLAAMASGRWFLGYSQTSANTSNACFVSLSGTTTSVANQVTVGTGTASLHAFVLSATKVFVSTDATSSNSNIVTDSSGTASIGTAITTASSSGSIALYQDGNALYCGGLSSTSIVINRLDVSGASPTVSSSITIGTTAVMGSLRITSNSVLQRSASLIYGTGFVQALSSTIGLLPGVNNGIPFVKTRLGNNYGGYRGKSDSERWYANSYEIVKTECVA